MALIRWEPSEGLSALRREMDHLLEDFFGKGPFHLGDAGTFSPSVEVADTKDAWWQKHRCRGSPRRCHTEQSLQSPLYSACAYTTPSWLQQPGTFP
jgi:hypothetical protein